MPATTQSPKRTPWSRIGFWLRGSAALLVLLLVVRLGWGWWAGRKLDKALAAARQHGVPVSAEDIQIPQVPDERNAFQVQLLAEQVVGSSGVDSPFNTNMDYRDYPPYPPKWHTAADLSETAHVQAFVMARKARGLSEVQLNDRLTPSIAAMSLNYLNPVKALANTLSDGALRSHVHGDDVEAIERISDTLHLARSLYHDDFVVSHLVGIGIESLACNRAQVIASSLRIKDNVPLRKSIEELIHRLQDEAPQQQSFQRAMRGEGVSSNEQIKMLSAGSWAIRPLADDGMRRSMLRTERLIPITAMKSLPEAKAPLEEATAEWTTAQANHIWNGNVPVYSRCFDGVPFAISAVFERHFRVIATKRLAATSLAIQLYRTDKGRWPDKLEELVPKYLPQVPADPFSSNNAPIQYIIVKNALPNGDSRRLLSFYEEGSDVDEGPDPRGPEYGWHRHFNDANRGKQVRQYRDLQRIPPASP